MAKGEKEKSLTKKAKGKGVKGGASVKVDSVSTRGKKKKTTPVNDVSSDGETASIDSDKDIPMDMRIGINI